MLVVEQVLAMQEAQQEQAAEEHQKVQQELLVPLVTELRTRAVAARVLFHCLTTLDLRVLVALELLLFVM
jgi:hypothetical protein